MSITATDPPSAALPAERLEDERPEAEQPEAEQPGAEQPGADQPEAAQPQAEQPRADRPDADPLRLVEALLFAAEAPLDEASLKERLPEGSDPAALVAELAAFYRDRGVNIVRVAHGWTLRTAPDLAPHLNLERKVVRKLSRAATETLAIVAYHQPVTRAEIEEIRGVVISKGTLDALMETGWIMPKGRRQTPGRPVTWVTTEQFLLHFGLADIADLPGVEELRAAGLIGRPTVTTLSESAGRGELPFDAPDSGLEVPADAAPEPGESDS